MRLRYASFSQKNGRARRQTRRGGASGGRDGPVGAAGLFDRGSGPEDDPLLLSPATGHWAPRPVARTGEPTPPVRLSPAVHPAAAGGRAVRDQSNPPALSGGRAHCPQASGPPQGDRHPGANPGGSEAKRTLVPRLRLRPVCQRTALPRPQHRRRCHQKNAWVRFRTRRSPDGEWLGN